MQLPRVPAPRPLKEGLASHQGLVLWILGAIVFFQVVFHFTASSVLRGEKEDVWAMCADGNAGASSSLQCAEVELFRSWHDASLEADEMLLKVTPRSRAEQDVANNNAPQDADQASTVPSTEMASTASTTEAARESSTKQASENPIEESSANAGLQQAATSNLTEWAQGLIDIQAKYQSRLSGLLEHHSRLHPAAAERAKPLLDQIVDVGRQMCADPERRSRPECAEFLQVPNVSNASAHGHGASAAATGNSSRSSKMAELDERLHELEEKDHVWEQAFSDKARELARELCSDPSRRGYAACADFAKQDKSQQPTARSALRGSPERRGPRDLHWSSVAAWESSASSRRGRTEPPVLTSNELRHSHWRGTIPKVACVAVIPCGRMVKPWIKYFIDNFNMQHYEGPRQLVLVYHYQHAEAARAVKIYADGTFIKAVPTRDPDYPSAASFRFGAWLSDAEVVARWDFDAWHHSQRLSMQIRALAYADRPASLLREWSVRAASGDLRVVSGGRNWDASLVGEAAWMRENWYPALEEGRVALESTLARDAVSVNASELSVYDEGTHELAATRCHFKGK